MQTGCRLVVDWLHIYIYIYIRCWVVADLEPQLLWGVLDEAAVYMGYPSFANKARRETDRERERERLGKEGGRRREGDGRTEAGRW